MNCLTVGNLDRHHYETFRDFGNVTFHMHLDNGRAWVIVSPNILANKLSNYKLKKKNKQTNYWYLHKCLIVVILYKRCFVCLIVVILYTRCFVLSRFGKSYKDDLSILAPLYQCCVIRYSTFIKLSKFYLGPEKLSNSLRKSLNKDSLRPILLEPHLIALDRRVVLILKEIAKCLEKGIEVENVIVDDFF